MRERDLLDRVLRRRAGGRAAFDFTAQVLAGDPVALNRIDEFSGDLERLPQGLVFTLPALHALLDPGQTLEYREFRNGLYASTLNQDLSAFDAEVVAFESSGKVDSSRYCLRRIDAR